MRYSEKSNMAGMELNKKKKNLKNISTKQKGLKFQYVPLSSHNFFL